MAFLSYTGAAPYLTGGSDDVQAHGLRGIVSGSPVGATTFNHDQTDSQAPAFYGLLSGVLYGSDCTASALVVTIPADMVFFAREVWINGATVTVTVADATTTAIWACEDGVLRTSAAASTFPSSFDGRMCCLLCVATSSGGVATVDNSVRHWARYADASGRRVLDNGGSFGATPYTIPVTSIAVVPASHQMQIFDGFDISGILQVAGKMRFT